jgi:hypothetical protein
MAGRMWWSRVHNMVGGSREREYRKGQGKI